MRKNYVIVALCFILLIGCVTTNSSRYSNTFENLIDTVSVDKNNSFIFGRFTGAFSHPLGIYLTNLETNSEIYITFIDTKNDDYGFFTGGRTQDDFNRGQENLQKANISIFSVSPGEYKITAVQLDTEKRKLNDEKYNPVFTVLNGEAIYIGDWSGMEAGYNTIMINHIQDKFDYTKTGLLKYNNVFQELLFKNMFLF